MRPLVVSTIVASFALMLLSGCSHLSTAGAIDRPVVSRLSPEQVKQIVIQRAAKNGFATSASDPWQLTLEIRDMRLMWTALLLPQAGRGAVWVNIDDASGNAEFVAPEIRIEQKFAEGSDWLTKIDEAVRNIKFPIELETLIRTAHFAGAPCTGGGGTRDGRSFLEYELRTDQAAPARFELRCYYTQDPVGVHPKMVTGVELAYVDAQVNRFLLVRSETL